MLEYHILIAKIPTLCFMLQDKDHAVALVAIVDKEKTLLASSARLRSSLTETPKYAHLDP
eukprot:SAG31_NODE_40645_length_279_cov_1.955556_1_plen_60_part_00